MKKNINTADRSAPYRTHSIGKITAPVKPQGEPKVTRVIGTDLRVKRG